MFRLWRWTSLFVAALLPASAAVAQLSPNARPTGGVVAAGVASIAQTANTTTINQTSPRTAINWQSFNIGGQQTVQFIQPSTSAIALNRVIGADPSQIAGRIDANGQIILINQSGVTFLQGAQINTSGLMVTAAGIGDSAFMGGSTTFNQPANPNARIVNNGTITIANAGLAALVAPSVANNGTISAKMGHVVLAGAQTVTLDLYGDGLLSLDVTNQVTRAPTGGRALETNTGVISAKGGTVQLTARAADGVVGTLVDAGGKIKVGGGTVVLNGVGGSISIEGQLSAAGGNIQVSPSGNVNVASTARISTSSRHGGGTIALGTTLARAQGGPSVTPAVISANVIIAPGAQISADATNRGNGGRIALLSNNTTIMAGSISAKGGPAGGDGGFVEVSGSTLAFTGAVDTSAPLGKMGTLLLDPFDLYISDVQPSIATYAVQSTDLPTFAANQAPDAATVSWVSPATLRASNTLINIAATNDIFVASSNGTANTLDLTYAGQLNLTAGRNITIDRGFTILAGVMRFTAGNGAITLGGSSGVAAGLITAPQLAALAPTNLQGQFGTNILMQAGTNIALADSTMGQTGARVFTLDLSTNFGTVTQSPGGTIVAIDVTSANGIGGTLNLPSTTNAIQLVDNIAVLSGDINVVSGSNMSIAGTLTANNMFFEVAKTNGILAFGNATDGGTEPLVLTAGTGGRVSLVADNYRQPVGGNTIATTGGTVELAPYSAINTSLFGSNGLVVDTKLLPIIQTNGGTIELGGFTNVPAGATAPAASASSVTIDGPVDLTGIATTLRMDATGTVTQPGGTITAGGIVANGSAVTLTNAANNFGNASGSATTTYAVISGAPLTLGDVTAGTTETIVAPTIAIAGSQSTPLLSLTALTGGISETGSLLVGTLVGSSAGGTKLTGANKVSGIGNFTATKFVLNNSSDLTIAGTLTAPSISILAPANVVTLADGATIVTGGINRPAGPIQAALEPSNGAPGAYIQAASFVQIGTSFVAGTGGGPATLQIATSGNMLFDPPLGLNATGTWLILGLLNGTAAGDVYIKALDVLYARPGSTNLFGTINGISGGAAAATGFIQPSINNAYRFNNCVIAAAVCSPPTVPSSTTLGSLFAFLPSSPSPIPVLEQLANIQFLMLPQQPGDWVDPDVVPPNISFVDF
jgi:filamentous hemagglutinin family protein